VAPLALLGIGVSIAAADPAPDRPATEVGGRLAGDSTWTRAASPYQVTSALEIPAGVTLSIEPGVEVQIGPRLNIEVSGRLRAEGRADAKINFKGAGGTWGGIRLLAGSGPSTLVHASFVEGGASRRPTVHIASSQVEVRDCSFMGSEGYAIEVVGASPTIRDTLFQNTVNPDTQPPAALQLKAGSDPVVLNNNFSQNNPYAIYQDASAGPIYTGNRFDYNGHNGVVLYGDVTRAVTLYSLGPRRFTYRIDNSGLNIKPGGALTIGPGATLAFQSGRGLRVEGSLAIRGTAARKVQLRPGTETIRAGQWRDILFTNGSQDYDPASGGGSIIDHAEIIGGGSTVASIVVEDASPRISNSRILLSGGRGISISGAGSTPDIVGNLIADSVDDNRGGGVHVINGAAPSLRFNIFRNNTDGIRIDGGSQPQIGPHNWFDFNKVYGVVNADRQTCVEAGQNDWGDPTGPNDDSDQDDACGLGESPGGGEPVSDNVRYEPFEGQMIRPQLLTPRCGIVKDPNSEITGLAQPGAKVLIYDNQRVIGEARAETGLGDVAPFRFKPASPLAAGSHRINVRSVVGDIPGDDASGITNPLEFVVDPSQVIDATEMRLSYDLEGTHYVQTFRDETGCLDLRGDGEWDIRPHPAGAGTEMQLTFSVPIRCPSGAPEAALNYLGQRIPLAATGQGDAYAATFGMRSGGAVELEFACGADLRRNLLVGTITPEYEGFVYNNAGDGDPRLSRIRDAVVTLYYREVAAPVGREWQQWNGAEVGGQTNPQTTGKTGWYGFYPLPGEYRVKVEAEGYDSYFSEPLKIVTKPVVLTIGLNPDATPRILLPYLSKGAIR
jgi:hypothetical protein